MASRSGVSGNLTVMTIDDDARAQVVREWFRSPLKQAEFCAEKGISTRALREWARRFGTSDRPEARALSIIDEALEKLTALRTALASESEDPFGRGDAEREEPEGHAEPAGTPPATSPAPRTTGAPPPRARGRGSFDWDDAEDVEPEPAQASAIQVPDAPTACGTHAPLAPAPLPMPAPGVFMLG